MVIDLNDARLTTLVQILAFLDGTTDVRITPGAGDRYAFIAGVLKRFGYARLRKPDKDLILRYLERTTGLSRQQLTRLVRRWCDSGHLASRRSINS